MVDRGRRPSVELVLRIGREIAAAFRRPSPQPDPPRHQAVQHPLLAPSGSVKILDFGMARSERDEVEITTTGAVMGTPAFMAPEQARGELAGTQLRSV